MTYIEECFVETLIHLVGQHGQMLLETDGHSIKLPMKVLPPARNIKAGQEGHAINCSLTTVLQRNASSSFDETQRVSASAEHESYATAKDVRTVVDGFS
jgi:hypothetical protein